MTKPVHPPSAPTSRAQNRLQEFIWWKDGGAKVKGAILLAKAGAFSWNWFEHRSASNGVFHLVICVTLYIDRYTYAHSYIRPFAPAGLLPSNFVSDHFVDPFPNHTWHCDDASLFQQLQAPKTCKTGISVNGDVPVYIPSIKAPCSRFIIF